MWFVELEKMQTLPGGIQILLCSLEFHLCHPCSRHTGRKRELVLLSCVNQGGKPVTVDLLTEWLV